jgi:hypothetical protein
LIFAFVIPSSLYTNNDEGNSSNASTLKRTSNFSIGIHVEKYGNQLNSKAVISDTILINSIIMIACMFPFSNPLLDFDSMPKI